MYFYLFGILLIRILQAGEKGLVSVRVLMFGWEFPPYKTGGLGTACYGLTRGLDNMGVGVTFVIPRSTGEGISGHVKVIGTGDIHVNPSEEAEYYSHVKALKVNVTLSPYERPEWRSEYLEERHRNEHKSVAGRFAGRADLEQELYGRNMFERIAEYAESAKYIAETEQFDVIHVHDWMTFLAGIEARKVSGKPLIVHVHSTEYDRGGGWSTNQMVYDIERTGLHEADRIIAVSNRTKQIIVDKYAIPEDKVSVVYNAIDNCDYTIDNSVKHRLKRKTVLFLGRITLQKGPEYFLQSARKVLDKEPDVTFVMTGDGDMMHKMVRLAADLKIGHRVIFTGFQSGLALDRIYDMADLYVMTSVSEPFGITPLEAMSHEVPVIISKQSGVSEVIKHALKVDFWDTDKLASDIIALLRYGEVRGLLKQNGKSEMRGFSWDKSATQCISVYSGVTEKVMCT